METVEERILIEDKSRQKSVLENFDHSYLREIGVVSM